ncbi:hypothetical protein [Solimonas terrae]|uniref:Uncharacterized protein n=1 Tax=Solimonas terrae TaxID=1396819 RepID=A0A6M2BQY5_9GAMM|nr:hypothetical protein [Solimonas terrae]NGY04730.1 hypothetical protein [Solimonas terrae]
MNSPTVMQRLGWVVLSFFGFGLLWVSGEKAYVALTNKAPTTVDIADIGNGPLKAKWIDVVGGELDLADGFYKYPPGQPETILSLFIPYRSVGNHNSEIHVLVETSDPRYVRLYRELAEATTRSSKDALLRESDGLLSPPSLRGLVRFGVEDDLVIKEKLKALSSNVPSGVVVLNLGEAPAPLSASSLSAVVGIGILGLVFARRKTWMA